MIRVVIDTGVVLSAAFKDRKPEEIILTIAGNEDFEWIASPEIIKEYAGVLAREKFGLPPSVLQNWSEIFETCISVIEPEIRFNFPRDQAGIFQSKAGLRKRWRTEQTAAPTGCRCKGICDDSYCTTYRMLTRKLTPPAISMPKFSISLTAH